MDTGAQEGLDKATILVTCPTGEGARRTGNGRNTLAGVYMANARGVRPEMDGWYQNTWGRQRGRHRQARQTARPEGQGRMVLHERTTREDEAETRGRGRDTDSPETVQATNRIEGERRDCARAEEDTWWRGKRERC